MGSSLVVIQQGSPTVLSSTVTFLGTGSAGDPTACRRLVFPSSVSPLIAPLVYSIEEGGTCFNPTTTTNLDNQVLTHPITSTVRTLTTTKALRFEGALSDVVVEEAWEPQGGASMPTSFFRLLYDYLANASLIDSVDGPFIQWEPRDRSDRVYDVELLSLTVGDGGEVKRFNVRDVREAAGQPLTLDGALTGVSPNPTGLIDEVVRLRMKIVAEA